MVSPRGTGLLGPKGTVGGLGPGERAGFGPFCPDAVFEVRSHHQKLDRLRGRLQAYLRNGVRVAVLASVFADRGRGRSR
ncbi:MAG: hypothetical protein C4303_02090 [candidate division GAL15 bacterium]